MSNENWKVSQFFEAFSEYLNFKCLYFFLYGRFFEGKAEIGEIVIEELKTPKLVFRFSYLYKIILFFSKDQTISE